MTRCLLTLLVAAAIGPGLRADDVPREQMEFFEAKIRPLLVENCFKCHGGTKVKGGLRLDSRAALLKGGDNGPVIVPGEPKQSRLIEAVGYEDVDLRMPPRGKLDQGKVAQLTEWVRIGAPWPETKTATTAPTKKAFDLAERAKHWSLQPLTTPSVPPVKNATWVQSPIDAFVLAELEKKGLTPAGPADRRTLLRRVTFDLIGLPPTPAEIEAFVNDKTPAAFATVVDRLLASPHYGERWARHWLDLVRYADTMGHEFDFNIEARWQYRDYVIRAFNADLPFDQLVTEHVAGDLLPTPRRHPGEMFNESVLGTGFWLLGESKHAPVDSRADQADRIDNQIDVFGKTFLGMTIACARCHDHKFDAISTRDYYSLAGYLQSSRPDTAFIDNPAPREDRLQRQRELMEAAARLAAQQCVEVLRKKGPPARDVLPSLVGPPGAGDFQAAKKIWLDQLQFKQTQHDEALARATVFADARTDKFHDWLSSGEAFALEPATTPLMLDAGYPGMVGRVLPLSRASSHRLGSDLQGTLRSQTFVITKKNIHYRASGNGGRVKLIVNGLQHLINPIYGSCTFEVNTKPLVGRPDGWKEQHAKPLLMGDRYALQWHTQDVSMWIGQRAYIEVVDAGPATITLDQVLFSDDGPPPDGANLLVLDLLRNPAIAGSDTLDHAFAGLLEETFSLFAEQRLAGRADYAARAQLINAALAEWQRQAASKNPNPYLVILNNPDVFPNPERWDVLFKRYEDLAMPIPPPHKALALCDGTPINENVFIRGNSRTLGDETPRRFLEVFGGTAPGPDIKGSGRLELARQIIDPARTPILPRVLVNRLWKHHFGQGIVRSVDDFGVLGQPPSHPELLDYLTGEFVKNGWSLKKMHRLLVLSSTYQMASTASAQAEEADPGNVLLHRMPVRRLEAEALRDALLAVSGRLDGTMFGPGVAPFLTPYMQGRGRPATSGPLDGAGRRSIYLAVRRNFLNPMFQAFDFPTPFSTMGKRSVSNVPAQALTMLNNPLVAVEAKRWAKKVLAEPAISHQSRIEKMYLTALCRLPREEEMNEALAFVGAQSKVAGNDYQAWTDLAHVMFNLKEFVYVQ